MQDEIQYNQDSSTGDGRDSHVLDWFMQKIEPFDDDQGEREMHDYLENLDEIHT